MIQKKKTTAAGWILLGLCLTPGALWGQEAAPREDEPAVITDSVTRSLDEVVVSATQILGGKFQARHRTGSAYYVSPQEIQRLGYTDINRMLRAVPGVNMYEEDGYGLRPNISLRGTKAERSERISIMEDGILAAPAPYAAPAAYYFPNAARMHAVEVLKGSSQVQYGPFTTGGAINLVSAPIPKRALVRANASYGSFATLKGHVLVGNSHKHFGYLVEYLRYQSDGFKENKGSDRQGFVRNDVIAKVRINTARTSGVNHALELKFGFANEHSDETYLGLTEADFARTPYMRYAAAQVDNIKTRHGQWALTYLADISAQTKLTAQAYYNHFYRNWYKLNDVRIGTGRYEKKGLSEILRSPEVNERYMSIVKGERDYAGEALFVRANNRSYYSRGVQMRLEHKLRLGAMYLNLEGALRYHEDAEDRFQWDDTYSMRGGRAVLHTLAIQGSQANRITSAEAWAGYVLGKLTYHDLVVTAGLRVEDVTLHKKDYGTKDTRRTGHQRILGVNHVTSVIPSLGANYKFLPWLSAFAGLHKGFAPPSAGFNQKPESSVNAELGLRLATGELRAEVVGYHNSYSNMLGSDLAASGGTGTLEQFDVGRARVGGAEIMVQYQPLPLSWRIKMPLQLSYTYTHTEMLENFESDSWGRVFIGDEIPYIYRHAIAAQLGIEHRLWDVTLSARYNGDMRTTPGQGRMAEVEKVPAHCIIDASARVQVLRGLSIKVNAVNLLNKRYLVSRHPSGLRAGHPFGIYLGINYTL